MCSSTSLGIPSSRSVSLRAWRNGGTRIKSESGPVGTTSSTSLVDAHGKARSVRGGCDVVHHLVHALAARICQVEGPPVEVRPVGDVVERPCHPVHGHDIRLAEIQPDERHPLRHHLAHALDRLEEVVGTVDLVHLAGLGVAHDDPGPVHAPGHELLLAHRSLSLELGGVIGRGQPLPLVEASPR